MVDLRAVEALATDQSSLKAAAGLAKPGKWSGVGISHDGALIWGECAGSGANPYRVMADLRDLGNKCTCPSRKFPCKHVLALLWSKAEAVLSFAPADTPDWVTDWLGRRRGGGIPKPAAVAPKDIGAAATPEPDAAAPEDPKAAARREAASAKRLEDTKRAILDALDALEQWIGDQLKSGLSAFIDDATARCRRIAGRLVDGKAAALAGRIDELPARLLALPAGDRVRGAVVELGRLVMLARAFRADPNDVEVRRAIATAEARDAVITDQRALRVTGMWEVLAERVETRRDGLVSQITWLLNLSGAVPRFAMLLDFFPATAGRRGSVFTSGEQFAGELIFYPAQTPLRAFLMVREGDSAPGLPWPAPAGSPSEALTLPLIAAPWVLDMPLLLPAGRIVQDEAGGHWWRSTGDDTVLPVATEMEGLIRGTDLTATAATWSGNRLHILAAQSAWGRIGVDG
jgi:hypothetical protein